MNIINKSTFNELARVHEPHCVSIYIPTHRAGGPEGIKQDRINFKNQIQEAARKLEAYNLTKDQISSSLKPARDLLEDESLWSHLGEGLMAFLYGDTMRYFRVPVSFDPQVHIEDHLYLLPAIPLLTDAGRHFIMSVSLNNVRFFEATRQSVSEVDVSALVPEGLEDAVGSDYEQQSLQFRSGQDLNPQSPMYHGQGSGEMPEKKEEAEKYFHQVNEGIMDILHDETAPLVIACVDYLFPIYKKANTYKHLEDEFIPGNHDETRPGELQQKSWKIVGEKFDKDRDQEISRFEEKLSAAKASFNAAEVLPAGMIGQAETMFVKKGSEIWGTYDPDKHSIDVSEVHRIGQSELINEAAIKTVEKGGKVLYLSEDEMPEEMETVAATYRYSM